MNGIRQFFIWLSGAGAECLERCPDWERRKYMAFGATVLVPTVFAFIAASYAISTLTDNVWVISLVALAWGLIILTIDRALLATYRSYQPLTRKVGQFFLRILVAVLMGLTISHPLTLLLFKDTINSVVEEERSAEIAVVRQEANDLKAEVEEKIGGIEEEVAGQRANWQQTYQAEFLVTNADVGLADPSSEMDEAMRAEMERKIAESTQTQTEQIAGINAEVETLNTTYTTLQGELDFWQREFENEVNGQRSGIVGLGPRAKSIRDDQLEWRRTDARRIGETLDYLTSRRTELTSIVASLSEAIQAEYAVAAAEKATEIEAERDRVAVLKQQVQEQQAGQFVEQQNALRDSISMQIDARLAELERLQGELAAIGNDEVQQIAGIRAEPRRDILTQTLALHGLFENGAEGGTFALMAYLILAALFMLVDTIPLIVKFFSKPGPYDSLVDVDEVRFDRERDTYLKSFNRYMNELGDGRLLHLTRNKPLETALVEGVDRSRAAKEFLEHLMELEAAFETRIEEERQRLESSVNNPERRVAMLQEMADNFYADLRRRMSRFFNDESEGPNLIPAR